MMVINYLMWYTLDFGVKETSPNKIPKFVKFIDLDPDQKFTYTPGSVRTEIVKLQTKSLDFVKTLEKSGGGGLQYFEITTKMPLFEVAGRTIF